MGCRRSSGRSHGRATGSSRCGSLHPRALIKAVETKAVKGALREATEEAARRGVFGVPSLLVGDEVFWGDDRLEDAVEAAS